jgi:uncharacterized protein
MLRLVLEFVLIVFLARAFWRLVDGVLEGITGPKPPRVPDHGVQMVRDPVCGTFVLPSRAVTLNERGASLYFCSTECRDRYRAQPADVRGRTA